MAIDKSHVDIFYPRHPYYKELIANILPEDFSEQSVIRWLLEGFGMGKLSIHETKYTKRLIAALTRDRGGFSLRLPTFKRLTENAVKRVIARLRLSEKMDYRDIALTLNLDPASVRKIVSEVDRVVYDPSDAE